MNRPPWQAGATFSPCRTWRYRLWRHFSYPPTGQVLAVIGLNPSTADESKDDPTIRRIIGYARRWGYGGIMMLNLFAFRATDPRLLRTAADPIGPDNERHLLAETEGRRVLCAWGAMGSLRDRASHTLRLLRDRHLVCLGTTKNGQPKHVLYLKQDVEQIAFGASRIRTDIRDHEDAMTDNPLWAHDVSKIEELRSLRKKLEEFSGRED